MYIIFDQDIKHIKKKKHKYTGTYLQIKFKF